jgi:hypothetical protein
MESQLKFFSTEIVCRRDNDAIVGNVKTRIDSDCGIRKVAKMINNLASSALLLVGFLFLAVCSDPAEAATTPDGLPCVSTEGQAWWMRTPGKSGTEFGHLHVGACMPWGQKVTGKFTLPVTVIMHDNPGKFQYFNPVYKTDSQEFSTDKNCTLLNKTCPVGTCTYTVPIEIDTAKWNLSGLQELRIRAYIKEPDGKIMHSSVNVFPDVQNGNTRNDMDRKRFPRGKGWYTGTGYCEADILASPPWSRSRAGLQRSRSSGTVPART